MNRFLLMVVILGATVAVRADSITIGPESWVISADPDRPFTQHFVVPNTEDSGWLTSHGKLFHEDLFKPGHSRLEDLDHWTGDLHFSVAEESERHWRHASGHHYIAEINDPVPTPEPATILMLGTGLCGVIGAARRKLLR